MFLLSAFNRSRLGWFFKRPPGTIEMMLLRSSRELPPILPASSFGSALEVATCPIYGYERMSRVREVTLPETNIFAPENGGFQ